jgi:predicted ATPase
MAALSKLCIQGYKSISGAAEIDFAPLNILIGANGAGKSNLISFFTLLNQIVAGNLQYFIQKQGGPDVFLSYGRKVTPKLSARLYFDQSGYFFQSASYSG